MAGSGRGTRDVQEVTTAVSQAWQASVEFQRHFSHEKRSNELLRIEFRHLELALADACKKLEQVAAWFTSTDGPPDGVMGISGTSYHEIALNIVHDLVDQTLAVGWRKDAVLCFKEERRIRHWDAVRHFWTKDAAKLEPSEADVKELSVGLRHESLVVADGRRVNRKVVTVIETPASTPTKKTKRAVKKRPGRPSKESSDEDKGILDAWKRGRYVTYADCAKELKLFQNDGKGAPDFKRVERVVNREQQRERRRKSD